jgi:hypothetical protein
MSAWAPLFIKLTVVPLYTYLASAQTPVSSFGCRMAKTILSHVQVHRGDEAIYSKNWFYPAKLCHVLFKRLKHPVIILTIYEVSLKLRLVN